MKEELVIKEAAGEAYASTAYYIHHPQKTSRGKLEILERP